jgi:hypothetical protein
VRRRIVSDHRERTFEFSPVVPSASAPKRAHELMGMGAARSVVRVRTTSPRFASFVPRSRKPLRNGDEVRAVWGVEGARVGGQPVSCRLHPQPHMAERIDPTGHRQRRQDGVEGIDSRSTWMVTPECIILVVCPPF